jgi:4-hydroxybenzoate polyprenyltransferase
VSSARALLRLLRLPSVLTVPGDVLVGAAWDGSGDTAGAPLASGVIGSSFVYLSGMALNDWADREIDAVERPRRPIPAGEIAPPAALATALGLTGASLAAAGLGGSRRLKLAGALAAVVWTYDLMTKDTPAGPWTMASARALDVLVGAGSNPVGALVPAGAIGAHALVITLVSAHEAEGGDASVARGALAGCAAIGGLVAASALAGRRGPRDTGLALAAVGTYAFAMGKAGRAAMENPDAAGLQRLVGTGVMANMPLQAALLASRGRAASAAALLASFPFARRAARKVAVT